MANVGLRCPPTPTSSGSAPQNWLEQARLVGKSANLGCVVRVWRCRSARHGSGRTRGSICRARAGACSRWLGGVRKCGGTGACDHGRRSGPITMIFTSVGRGDVGPFRHDGINVRRTAEALVAIGDGADTEGARVTCGSAVEDGLRHDVGGRTRRCTMAMFIALIVLTGTSGSTRSPWGRRCNGRRRRALPDCGQIFAD